MKIAIDAMGGDRAPGEILAGVSRALEKNYLTPADVIVVGLEDQLEPVLGDYPGLRDVERRVQTRPADESAAELALAITRILYDNGSPAAPPVTPTPRD